MTDGDAGGHELVDRGEGVVAERGERGDRDRAAREREAAEHFASGFAERVDRDRRVGRDTARIGPPRLEGAEIAAGQVVLCALGNGAQPTELVARGELAEEVEGRCGVPRGRVGGRDEHDEDGARCARELARDGAVPRAVRRQGRDDRRALRRGRLRDHVRACGRLGGQSTEPELRRDLSEERRARSEARRLDGVTSGRTQSASSMGDDRRVHVLRCTDDHQARLRGDDPVVEIDEGARARDGGSQRKGSCR